MSRGIRRLCPHCGQAKLFRSFYRLNKKCPHCQEVLEKDPMDTLGLMYISTAFFTGLGFFIMFWLLPLEARWLRIGVASGVVLLIFLTLPFRKALAIALTYYMEKSWR
ncbi:MAG: DUF983 domain-containing protein [Deltaproteobacteria bacterium]|nr:DUF983 domain-containing protein [Deltaproteobacteria bacterium]